MTPLRFQLDGSPIWEGFWTGETWNGFVVLADEITGEIDRLTRTVRGRR